MSSARLRTLLTRPRRRARAVLASIAAVTLATAGLVLASALPAEAHNTAVASTCQALTMDLNTFGPGGANGETNTITVTIDGKVVDGWDHKPFGTGLDPNPGTIAFSDSTVAHTWEVDVYAYDDPYGNRGFSTLGPTKPYTGTSTPCTAPTIAAHASTCTAIGGSSAITADITGIAPADAYLVQLFSGGAVLSSQSYAPGTLSSPLNLGTRPAGTTYVVKVTDTTLNLSAESTVPAASCPQVGGFEVALEQCTAPGQSGFVILTPSGFLPGHAYTVREGGANGNIVHRFSYTAGGSYRFALPAPSDVQLYVTDDQGGVLVAGPVPVQLEVCPTQQRIVSATAAGCVLDRTTSDVTVTLADLTAGRKYTVAVGGVTKDVTAGSTTEKVVVPGVAPGSYTATVTDVAAPGVQATTPVTVEACPLTPVTHITPAQCTTVLGTSSIGLQVTQLVPGRPYTVTVTSPSTTVATIPFQATESTKTFDFPQLPAGQTYTVKVQDVQESQAVTLTVIAMNDCPQVAALSVECTTVGNVGTLALTASDLTQGHAYTVRFERQNTATGAYSVVSEKADLTAVTPADLRLSGVNPGQVYRISLIDQTNPALTDVLAGVEIQPGCSTGEVESVTYTAGGSVSALALTGTDTGRLALIGLALLVPGAGLVGFSILRHRRKEVRE